MFKIWYLLATYIFSRLQLKVCNSWNPVKTLGVFKKTINLSLPCTSFFWSASISFLFPGLFLSHFFDNIHDTSFVDDLTTLLLLIARLMLFSPPKRVWPIKAYYSVTGSATTARPFKIVKLGTFLKKMFWIVLCYRQQTKTW